MQRLAYLACCTSLALGLATPTFGGALGSAASDAFRRLPQSAPVPAAGTGSATPAPAPAAVANDAAAAGAPVDPAQTEPTGGTAPSDGPSGASDSSLQGVDITFTEPGSGNGAGYVEGAAPQRVPEPGMLWLLGVGGVGLALALARKRRK